MLGDGLLYAGFRCGFFVIAKRAGARCIALLACDTRQLDGRAQFVEGDGRSPFRGFHQHAEPLWQVRMGNCSLTQLVGRRNVADSLGASVPF